jgi:hypothetical protein
MGVFIAYVCSNITGIPTGKHQLFPLYVTPIWILVIPPALCPNNTVEPSGRWKGEYTGVHSVTAVRSPKLIVARSATGTSSGVADVGLYISGLQGT